MWPFKNKKLIQLTEDFAKLKNETKEAIGIQNEIIQELTERIALVHELLDSIVKENKELAEDQVKDLDKTLKTFLGIKNYTKSPDDPNIYVEGGLLAYILDNIKQFNYLIKQARKG